MKSILSVIPLVAVAAALNEQCAPRTVTETVYASPTTTTVPPTTPATSPNAHVDAAPTCGPPTVYVTSTRQVTVTVVASGGATSSPTPTPSSTSSSSTVPQSSVPPAQSRSSAAPSYGQPPKPSPSAAAAEVAKPQDNTPPATSGSGKATSGSGKAISGKATFYGGNLSGGTCSFTNYTIPSGTFGTAYSGQAWDNGANCGRCVSVTGPNGKTVKAMIVDQCPECDPTHLDLFQDAFEQIGTLSAGIIPITFDFVDCDIASPLLLKNKVGTSPNWFSMQVMNGNTGVSSLEVSTNGGQTWKPTTRRPYNFFESPSGFGTPDVDVKVTSTNGKTIVVNKVSVESEKTVSGGTNF